MEERKSKSMTTNNGKTVGASIAGRTRSAGRYHSRRFAAAIRPEILWLGPHKRGIMRYRRACGAMSEDQRNCRSDGWQYGLVLQQVVCAFYYAMRRSSWMHVQRPSNAISHAPRTLQMSHVPNHDDL